MQDLNDLRLFAEVVRHGGFSAAARALSMPKSRLSKHVARLEGELGVRLLERTTRRLVVTEVGQAVYAECEHLLASAEAAEQAAALARTEPAGEVRVSCPSGLSMMAWLLPGFLTAHPKVRVRMLMVNRPVNLVEERIDIALRVRERLDTDPGLTMRTLGASRLILAASPGFLAEHGGVIAIDALPSLPTLSSGESEAEVWRLNGPGGDRREFRLQPRLRCGDFGVVHDAAAAGLGVALLPDLVCEPAFRNGSLVPVAPGWSTSEGTIHLVFTGRQGIRPPVRAFIDHLAKEFPGLLRQCQEGAPAADGPLDRAPPLR